MVSTKHSVNGWHFKVWGVGGVEGGPPQFNLAALCGCGSSGSSSTTCEDYGGDPELTGSVRTTPQQGSSFCVNVGCQDMILYLVTRSSLRLMPANAT